VPSHSSIIDALASPTLQPVDTGASVPHPVDHGASLTSPASVEPSPTTAAAAAPPSDPQPGFVAPSSYLRPDGGDSVNAALDVVNSVVNKEMSIADAEQLEALRKIRAFLRQRTSNDVLPLSYRLIILDSALTIKASLSVMMQQGIVSAPMWDSKTSSFAGMITASDYINVIQYYLQNPQKVADIDKMKLRHLSGMLSISY
jgi:5'-AMP-activated protein kinase regulatory gamma subunit